MAQKYIEIPIVPVAIRCGIQLNQRTLDHREVEGYCPFCKGSRNHLYLNTQTNQWYCQKCGQGGNAVTLYAKIFGTNNETAFRELMHDRVIRFTPQKTRGMREPPASLAPLGVRHDVYFDMLMMMDLSPDHKENLLKRGLSQQRIEENMYRTVPADWRRRRSIAQSLAKRYPLMGVPGFFTRDGGWSLWGIPGILVPYLTVEGYIQGLQIRLDNPARGKYRWLSSNPEKGFENGTAACSWIHVAGNTQNSTACITEGGLKGDVASYLRDDALFICMPGAGNIEYLVETLAKLPNLKRIVGCYDQDQMENEQVSQAVSKMEQEIKKHFGITYEPFRWNPRYNGIDDYLFVLKKGPKTAA